MYYKIKLGAITNAQRAQRILRMNGYSPSISRIQNPGPGDGCGYIVSVSGDKSVLDILRSNGIKILGVETD